MTSVLAYSLLQPLSASGIHTGQASGCGAMIYIWDDDIMMTRDDCCKKRIIELE